MANTHFADLVKFVAVGSGTGSFVVSSAVTGYQTPLTANASNFNYHYRAESTDLAQWEIGTGAYTSSNTTLTRSPLINSVGGTSAINFSVAPTVGMGVILAEDFQAIGQFLASNTSEAATTGNIGEVVSASVLYTARVGLASGTWTNLTSIALGSGDWDVSGYVDFEGIGAATTSFTTCAISSYSSAGPTSTSFQSYGPALSSNVADVTAYIPSVQYLIGSSQTFFLNAAQGLLSGSSVSAWCYIQARRMR